MIRQDDKPIDLFWCCGRHFSEAAIGFEIVDKNTIMSKNSGSVDALYRDFEGHEELWRGGGGECVIILLR